MINVSVLITCKDKEQYLDECVSSVLQQTKQPREIIIVHDGCENPVHHSQATTIMLKTNLGVQGARKEAFRFSTGELILFLDGDDMLSPDYLEKMTLVIASGADIAYPDIYFFPGENSSLSVSPERLTPNTYVEYGKLPIPVTCLMKRVVFEDLDGFKNWDVLEDLDFWLRAMCNDWIFKKAHTLFWYRQEGVKRNAVDLAKKKRIMDEIAKQFVFDKGTINYALEQKEGNANS